MSRTPPVEPQEQKEGCLSVTLGLLIGGTLLIAVLIGIPMLIQLGPTKTIDRVQSLWNESTSALAAVTESDRSSQHTPIASGDNPATAIEKMKNAEWLEFYHYKSYKAINNAPWVKDGLNHREADTAQNLLNMGANDHKTLEALLTRQWIHDHIIPSEAKAIANLMFLSYRDPQHSRQLASMPFMQSITEADALLISGLHGRAHRDTLQEFMRHPSVADGITDTETVLATAATTIDSRTHLNRILNPGNAIVETIQTSSPRTSNLTISIVRAGTRRATDSSIIVEEAVEYVEDSMGMLLPTNHVIVLLDDSGVVKGFAGANYGEAIAYLRKGEDGSDWDKAGFTLGMVHEVAHYFWRGSEDWIDEGMANTIERGFGIDRGLPRQMLTTERKECSVKTLQELSSLEPSKQSAQFQCNYYLGEKLFLELQNSMTPAAFQQAVNSLYQKSLVLREQDRTAGIQQVREAFQARNDIVQKHWDGTPIPVVKATSTPTPTPPAAKSTGSIPPTQTPTTPTLFFTQHNPDMGFSIEIPRDWDATLEGDTAIYQPPDSPAHILLIHTSQITREEYLKQAEDQLVTGHLLQSGVDWPELSGSSSWGLNTSGASYYETQYVGKHESSQCTENGIIRIHESKSTEGKPITTIVEMVSCQEEADQMLRTRTTVLESFTVTRPWSPSSLLPTATALPIATPVPNTAPIPSALPAPTPTPANLVVTRINTSSAGATSTPSPPLRATNTPRPRPTPTPTPTPVPTATPTPEFLSHRNAEPDDYTILYPHGWNPSHSGSTARFTSPDGSANLEIQAHAVSNDASLAGFVDQYRDEWLTQVRTWHDYVATSTTGEFRGAINFVEIRFRRQISPGSCVDDGITHLYRSRYFPARMTGYSVTMTVCQEDLATMEQKRNTVMESFKEQ